MPSTHKKVIVRRFLGDVLPGYLPVNRFVSQSAIPLLGLDGRMSSVPLSDIKQISYVRDFNLGDTINPERLLRRAFLARPRSEGLWIRIVFRASTASVHDPRAPDTLEGLTSTDISLFDDLLTDLGVHLIPPDTRSNTQRIFVPRSSLIDLQILAVITTPSRPKRVAPAPGALQGDLQEDLFATPLLPSTRPN